MELSMFLFKSRDQTTGSWNRQAVGIILVLRPVAPGRAFPCGLDGAGSLRR